MTTSRSHEQPPLQAASSSVSRARAAVCAALSLSLSLFACSDTASGLAVLDPVATLPQAQPTLQWTEGAPCPLARFEASGAVVSGELWVLGGFVSSHLEVTRRVDIYQPASDSWRRGPDLPGAETHLGVATLGDGTSDEAVVLVGGFKGRFDALRAPVTAEVWRLDLGDGTSTRAGEPLAPAAASWVAGPALPSPAAAFAWTLLGHELHLAGGLAADGESDSGAHLVWDLAGAAGWRTASPLPTPRDHGGGAGVHGLFYVLAGRLGWNEIGGDLSVVEAFDPLTSTWSERAALPGARSEIGAATTVLSDGRLLVVGGSRPGVRPSADVLLYDPATDRWAALPSLPTPRKGTVARQIGSRLIVTTGSPTSVDPSDTTFVGCCL